MPGPLANIQGGNPGRLVSLWYPAAPWGRYAWPLGALSAAAGGAAGTG